MACFVVYMVAGINLEPVKPNVTPILSQITIVCCTKAVFKWLCQRRTSLAQSFKTLRGCGFELSGFFDNNVKKSIILKE